MNTAYACRFCDKTHEPGTEIYLRHAKHAPFTDAEPRTCPKCGLKAQTMVITPEGVPLHCWGCVLA